jgi:AcrR family transcriptional regulator
MCARPAHPELRADIVKAATRIVEDCGPDCVTMRQVAEKVGYSPTTLYLYFKDKDAILGEVMAAGFDDLADFCTMSEVGPLAVDKFRQRGRAYVVWGLMHQSLYQLMFETRVVAEPTPEQLGRISRAGVDSWRVLDEAIAAGDIHDVADPTEFGVALWAATHGVTALAIARRISAEAARAQPSELLAEATRLVDTLVDGMLASHVS